MSDVDYDRLADSPAERPSADEQRRVILDEDEPPALDQLQYWENEKPPHYGGE
ncbi:hypothetical protein [Corynebacterium mayonis]|uniref:hypothetical protein n=1 Tax=Corynebacterium mayonis TaxID=3062461 RepID=UPI0031407DB4